MVPSDRSLLVYPLQTFFPKQNAPNSFELGTFAEQPSPEVCSPKIMPKLAIERLFKIAHYPNISTRRILILSRPPMSKRERF